MNAVVALLTLYFIQIIAYLIIWKPFRKIKK